MKGKSNRLWQMSCTHLFHEACDFTGQHRAQMAIFSQPSLESGGASRKRKSENPSPHLVNCICHHKRKSKTIIFLNIPQTIHEHGSSEGDEDYVPPHEILKPRGRSHPHCKLGTASFPSTVCLRFLVQLDATDYADCRFFRDVKGDGPICPRFLHTMSISGGWWI